MVRRKRLLLTRVEVVGGVVLVLFIWGRLTQSLFLLLGIHLLHPFKVLFSCLFFIRFYHGFVRIFIKVNLALVVRLGNACFVVLFFYRRRVVNNFGYGLSVLVFVELRVDLLFSFDKVVKVLSSLQGFHFKSCLRAHFFVAFGPNVHNFVLIIFFHRVVRLD